MKILVTGAGGFVGKRVVALLASQGHEVVALVRVSPEIVDHHYFESERVNILVGDLTDFDVGALPRDIDGIIALAQSAHFRQFPDKAEEVFAVNVTSNVRLLNWAVANNVRRIVLASSGGIYGGKLGVQFQETDIFPVNSPLGFYLGSKLCSEIVFQNYRQFLDCAVILRPFFIYGPRQRPDMFVNRIINSVREGKSVTLQGRDGLKVNPIYVDDAAIAFVRALDQSGHKIINVAGPQIVSLRAIAEGVAAYVKRDPVYIHADGQPVDYVADIAIAREHLQLEPRSFDIGLAQTLDAEN